MAFKRYDTFYARLVQMKFDRKLKICPFCEQNSYWLLDIEPDVWKTKVTAKCDKCEAQISTKYSFYCGNKMKVVDVGKTNINNIISGEHYNLKSLKNLTVKN